MPTDKEIIELIEQPVDLRKLVDKLFFALPDLEQAALKQPKLYLESGRFRAQQALRLGSYRRKLAKVAGEKSLKIRQKADGKITEGAIKTELSTSHTLQELQKQVDNAEVFEEFAKQLSEAYKERIMIINVLTKLRAAEISSELRSAMGEEEVNKLRKKANKARERFAELEEDD